MTVRRAATPTSAAEFLPENRSIAALRKAARNCQGCPLFQRATQTVFGAGATPARILLAGEQPGDQEDLHQGDIEERNPPGDSGSAAISSCSSPGPKKFRGYATLMFEMGQNRPMP